MKLMKLVNRTFKLPKNCPVVDPFNICPHVKSETHAVTVQQILDWAVASELDLAACFQRGVASTFAWVVVFLTSLFNPLAGTPLHFRHYRKTGFKYLFQVIDGLQRIRALLLFHLDKIAIPINVAPQGTEQVMKRRTKSEIHAMPNGHEILARFYNAKLLVTFYGIEMTDGEAAGSYIVLNNNTDLNPEERRGAYLGLIADWVRRSAGFVENFVEEATEGAGINTDSRLPFLEYVQLKRGRMVHDDLIAKSLLYEIWHQTHKKTLGIYFDCCDHDTLTEMYQSDLTKNTKHNQKSLEGFTSEVKRRWKMVEKWIKASGGKQFNTASTSDLLTLYQLTYALESEYGRNLKMDVKKFAQKLWLCLNELATDNPKEYGPCLPGEETMYVRLKNSSKPKLIEQKLALILMVVDSTGVSKRSSKKDRFFPRSLTFRRWLQVGGICEISGEKIEFINCDGGHRIPDCEGGDNSYKNLAALSKKVNNEMGSTPFNKFKKIWEARHPKKVKK